MNKQTAKYVTAAILWSAVFALGIGGTIRPSYAMMFWALVVALVACIVSGHIIAECAAKKACHDERLRVEVLGDLIAAKAVERLDEKTLTRLR